MDFEIALLSFLQYLKAFSDNLWRGELDLELTMLDPLWEHLATIERKLEILAKQEIRIQLANNKMINLWEQK
ncbi:transposase [Leptolyngbya sp. Heron Island J]|nr:transposase [Leptolyngbya sp. Heron Island J]